MVSMANSLPCWTSYSIAYTLHTKQTRIVIELSVDVIGVASILPAGPASPAGRRQFVDGSTICMLPLSDRSFSSRFGSIRRRWGLANYCFQPKCTAAGDGRTSTG